MSLFLPRNVLYLSILAGISTIALKTSAYFFTGSVSLLSDAAESIINLIAASIAFVAVRLSAKPADETHAYGHEKIEFFSSGFEGALILSASFTIAGIGFERLIYPHEPHSLDIGMVLSLAGALVNGIVALILLKVGKDHNSIVLEADGKHLLTDVWTTVGVLFGLMLARLTGFYWLDPVLAILVAILILYTGSKLIWKSFKGLMDHALPPEDLFHIRNIIQENLSTEMKYHALRSRQAGGKKFIDFHLLLPGNMSISEAHTIMEKLEDSIKSKIKDIQIQIHAEPIDDPRSYGDHPLVSN